MKQNNKNAEHNAVSLYLNDVKVNEDFDVTNIRSTNALPDDISEKHIYSDVVKIAWPSFIELMLTQLVSMVDMIMVGSLGNYAISAVGLSMNPKMVLMMVFMCLNVGSMALVARYRGMDNRQKAQLVLRQAVMVSFFLTLIVTVIGYTYCAEILKFICISKDSTLDVATLEAGILYFKIQVLGMPILAITSAITSSLRGIGSTKIAMIYNLAANFINVFFNYCLIKGNLGFPALGVAGASIATIIGQTCAMIFAVVVITRKKQYLRFSFKDGMKLDFEVIGSILRIGLPAMLEQVAMRIGNIFYTRTIVSLGTQAYATHQICLNLLALTFMFGQSLATPATSLVGQSIGKKRLDVADAYGSRTKRIGMIFSVFLTIIFFFFGGAFAKLYSEEVEIISECGKILRIASPMIILQSSQLINAGILRGAGDTKYSAWVVLVTNMIVRTVLSYAFVVYLHWGIMGAWAAFIIDQVLRSVLISIRFKSGKWKNLAMRRI